MKRWLPELAALLFLSVPFLRADYASAPLDPTLIQQPPYQYVGMIISTWDPQDVYQGSGAVVGNPKIVISCAHLPFDPTTLTWSTDNQWYRAFEGSISPGSSDGQPLRGHWNFSSYSSMVSMDGADSPYAFMYDFTAYYAYEDLGPGNAGFWYNGQAALVTPTSKIIVGYPSGLYSDNDPRQGEMHQAGPFSWAFTQFWGDYNEIESVTTGAGNSGGPVFVTNEAAMADPDRGLRFAAVLLAGGTNSAGASVSGVLAVNASAWDLVNDSLNAIGAIPLNDNWAAALELSGDTATSTGSNQYATKEPGEPSHAGNAGGHSLWWRWTAPGDGPVTVDTSGSGIDTLLGLYTGINVGSLTTVASNDDASATVTTSAVTFTAAAGTEYWIAVDGKNGATGLITLHVTFAPTAAPANDDFANATAISGLSAQVVGNNIMATKEPGEPVFTGGGVPQAGGKSVWWRWTAPTDGWVSLTTGGSDFDTLLSVYTGTAVDALTWVAANDDPIDTFDDSSDLGFSATAGTTYWISVDGSQDPTGAVSSGEICLSLSLAPTVPTIVVQPSSQTPNLGAVVVLGIAVRGQDPLTYQWYKDGVPISGATGQTYEISSFQASNTGIYTVVVNNHGGSVTSADSTLSPRGYPVITRQPQGQVVCAGATVTFSVVATSDTALTYQWAKDGVTLADGAEISGAATATLTISNAQAADAGGYSASITNATGSVPSASVSLTVIPALPSGGVVAMSAGTAHALFIGSDGGLWAVGDNSYGQLGDGTVLSRSRPGQVATGVAAAAAGYQHSLFLQSDGTLWAMGNNSNGRLGDGTTANRVNPVQVASGVVAASAGGGHSLFITSDGELWAMGANANGQLGDGTTIDRPTPVPVAAGVVAASAGGSHSLFIKYDGTLWAMGNNASGQLGDGTATSRTLPVPVANGVAAACAGPMTVCLSDPTAHSGEWAAPGTENSGNGSIPTRPLPYKYRPQSRRRPPGLTIVFSSSQTARFGQWDPIPLASWATERR